MNKHMNKLVWAAAITAVLAVPALAKSAKNQPPAALEAAMPAATKTFVKKAGITNLFEIQAGMIAEQKTDNNKVQDYAKMIVSDHQKAQNELKAAAKDINGVTVPQSLDQKHSKLIKRLQSTSDAKFLQTFKGQQVKGHKEGVKLFQDYGEAAQNPKLKQFAQQTLPVLKKHLQHAQNLPTTVSAPTVGSGTDSK
jgi:putative membrane protein